MRFNVKKSAWLRFDTGYNNHIMVNGHPLPIVPEVKYLGVVICAGRQFNVSLQLTRMKFLQGL